MLKGKTIRTIIGVLAVLIILVPLSGFPQSWKDVLTVIFALSVLLVVSHRFLVIEFFRLKQSLANQRPKNTAKKEKRTKPETEEDGAFTSKYYSKGDFDHE
jgi:predicted membrane protein